MKREEIKRNTRDKQFTMKIVVENLIITFTHIRAKFSRKATRWETRKGGREKISTQSTFSRGDFVAVTVPRTSLTCFQRTFRSFLGGNCITFSQPLVSIYSLIACKIHAADSRSLSPPCETSGRNSDPLRVDFSGGINLFGVSRYFSFTPANLSVCTLLFRELIPL